jgi:hypothetical protein
MISMRPLGGEGTAELMMRIIYLMAARDCNVANGPSALAFAHVRAPYRQE